VEKLVEGSLAKTNPGRAFTTSVMAALPMGAMSAGKAAALTAAATAKGATALKATGLGAATGAFCGSAVGVLSGWLGIKYSVETSRTNEEREIKLQTGRQVLALVLAVLGGQLAISAWRRFFPLQGIVVAWLMIALWGGYTIGLLAIIRRSQAEHKKLRQGQGQPAEEPVVRDWYEYRSPWTLLGLPLIHINSGMAPDGSARVAKGWLAIGGVSVGVVAIGGLSLGVIGLGGLAGGLIAVAGVAGGPIAVGGVALGGWAIGGLAIGYEAIGGVAVAWEGADGGVAIAREFASGRSARALHTNDEAVKLFQNTNAFFRWKETLLSGFLMLGWLPIPLIGWQVVRLLRRKKAAGHRPMTMGEFLGWRS
jgi:hypothetical protein